MILVNIMTRE